MTATATALIDGTGSLCRDTSPTRTPIPETMRCAATGPQDFPA